MAQGKMHSSPFHVESATYKYAVEHESENYGNENTIAHCSYLKKATGICSLWNSGYTVCSCHRCHYYHWEMRKDVECLSCAFHFKNKCCHAKKPLHAEVNNSCAQYCTYFYGKDKDERRFKAIRAFCERSFYVQAIGKLEVRLKSKQSSMKQTYIRLQSGNLPSDEVLFLRKKIKRLKAECATICRTLEEYHKCLAKSNRTID